jgi:hypothetical protein
MMSAQDDKIYVTSTHVFDYAFAHFATFHQTSRSAKFPSLLGNESVQRDEKRLLLFRQKIRLAHRLFRNHVQHVEPAAEGSSQCYGVWSRVSGSGRKIGGVQDVAERQHVR